MYLIDTNVLSEYRKGVRANAGVIRFFADTANNVMFLPPQVIGEIRAGITKLRRQNSDQALQRAETYELWLDRVVAGFGSHLLKFDIDAAQIWGALLSSEKKDVHAVDKQIAAIALLHDLVVVTRDQGEAFANISNLRVLNPFN